jgi:hypothetical protein
MVDYNVDIYLTGSNSNLLSSELATFLPFVCRYTRLPFIQGISAFSFKFFQIWKNPIKKKHCPIFAFRRFPSIQSPDFIEECAYKIVFDTTLHHFA